MRVSRRLAAYSKPIGLGLIICAIYYLHNNTEEKISGKVVISYVLFIL